MKMKTAPILLLAALMTGCASYTNWTPTVDMAGDPHAWRLQQDAMECRNLASRASGGLATETAKGAGVGALAGGAGGAAIGAVMGDPLSGALIGAAGAGLAGAAYQGYTTDENFKSAYTACLRGRGHRVIY